MAQPDSLGMHASLKSSISGLIYCLHEMARKYIFVSKLIDINYEIKDSLIYWEERNKELFYIRENKLSPQSSRFHVKMYMYEKSQ